MKGSRAGTEGYICKRSILADLQRTLTQRCFAGDMCAFSDGQATPRPARASGQLLATERSRMITPISEALFACFRKSTGLGF